MKDRYVIGWKAYDRKNKEMIFIFSEYSMSLSKAKKEIKNIDGRKIYELREIKADNKK